MHVCKIADAGSCSIGRYRNAFARSSYVRTIGLDHFVLFGSNTRKGVHVKTLNALQVMDHIHDRSSSDHPAQLVGTNDGTTRMRRFPKMLKLCEHNPKSRHLDTVLLSRLLAGEN